MQRDVSRQWSQVRRRLGPVGLFLIFMTIPGCLSLCGLDVDSEVSGSAESAEGPWESAEVVSLHREGGWVDRGGRAGSREGDTFAASLKLAAGSNELQVPLEPLHDGLSEEDFLGRAWTVTFADDGSAIATRPDEGDHRWQYFIFAEDGAAFEVGIPDDTESAPGAVDAVLAALERKDPQWLPAYEAAAIHYENDDLRRRLGATLREPRVAIGLLFGDESDERQRGLRDLASESEALRAELSTAFAPAEYEDEDAFEQAVSGVLALRLLAAGLSDEERAAAAERVFAAIARAPRPNNAKAQAGDQRPNGEPVTVENSWSYCAATRVALEAVLGEGDVLPPAMRKPLATVLEPATIDCEIRELDDQRGKLERLVAAAPDDVLAPALASWLLRPLAALRIVTEPASPQLALWRGIVAGHAPSKAVFEAALAAPQSVASGVFAMLVLDDGTWTDDKRLETMTKLMPLVVRERDLSAEEHWKIYGALESIGVTVQYDERVRLTCPPMSVFLDIGEQIDSRGGRIDDIRRAIEPVVVASANMGIGCKLRNDPSMLNFLYRFGTDESHRILTAIHTRLFTHWQRGGHKIQGPIDVRLLVLRAAKSYVVTSVAPHENETLDSLSESEMIEKATPKRQGPVELQVTRLAESVISDAIKTAAGGVLSAPCETSITPDQVLVDPIPVQFTVGPSGGFARDVKLTNPKHLGTIEGTCVLSLVQNTVFPIHPGPPETITRELVADPDR